MQPWRRPGTKKSGTTRWNWWFRDWAKKIRFRYDLPWFFWIHWQNQSKIRTGVFAVNVEL